MRRLCLAVMDAARRHVADARVPVLGVVPGEEGLAVGAGVGEAAEARGEVRAVLHCLELRLRIRVVVRDVRAAMAFGDVQIDQQGGHGLGAHARAAIGMQREGAGRDVVAGHGLGDQLFGQLGAFTLGD